MMALVKNKDSKAELAVRSRLHATGLRYRLHYKITGKPDIVFLSRRVAVFIDGNFWHGNDWKLRGLSSLAELFPNRTDWWVAKITRTVQRDEEVTRALTEQGWSVLRFWESDVLAEPDAIAREIAAFMSRQQADPAPRDQSLAVFTPQCDALESDSLQ